MWAALLLGAILVVGGLALWLVWWYVRDKRRERRKARFLAQLSAQYRRKPAALASNSTPDAAISPAKPVAAGAELGQMVTVEELVARIAGEGLPTRLRWDGNSDEDGWPTGVMGRAEE